MRPRARVLHRAYPRVRGDHVGVVQSGLASAYPRVRGDHLPLHGHASCQRDGLPPRARGSLACPQRRCRHLPGLPPRARGSPRRSRSARRRARPTPACAGITLECTRQWLLRRPTPACAGITVMPGAPCCADGPTPACAGITASARASMCPARAYPRVRGDHESSTVDRYRRRWPTPACAGITRRVVVGAVSGRAYPRVRGDHVGLSTAVVERERPTPACAGITGQPLIASPLRQGLPPRARVSHGLDHDVAAAYPRVRGDHLSARDADRADGLPPRARGSRVRSGASRAPRLRPTPACAGITA